MNLPNEFLKKMKSLLKDEYDDFIKCYDDERYYGLRVNALKISPREFQKIAPLKLKKIPWAKEGFYYSQEDKPTKSPYYYAGLYYIQEPSAMAPAEFIDIKPGDKVLDLCSAPGGKSTQIAARLQGTGVLISNDISGSRLKALVKNMELFGAKNSVVINESPEKLSQKFVGFFDKILVDAPCSGEGMFRKDEDAAKSWGIHSNEKCSVMQKNILYNAAQMLKPGGSILYSTCTFSPEENECIIEEFLHENKEFEIISLPHNDGIDRGRCEWCSNKELDKCARFWPHKLKGEGHFLALLKKNDGKAIDNIYVSKLTDQKKLKPYYDFCSQYLNTTFEGDFEMYGEYLYIVPKGAPSLDGIKVIRPGWYLGIIKKDRFEPSHALALSLKMSEVKNIIDFDSNSSNVLKYLKGETLNIEAKSGWNIVCVDNFTLGWAKGSGGIFKNYYPGAWRWIG